MRKQSKCKANQSKDTQDSRYIYRRWDSTHDTRVVYSTRNLNWLMMYRNIIVGLKCPLKPTKLDRQVINRGKRGDIRR